MFSNDFNIECNRERAQAQAPTSRSCAVELLTFSVITESDEPQLKKNLFVIFKCFHMDLLRDFTGKKNILGSYLMI